jgi:hypothetical protein
VSFLIKLIQSAAIPDGAFYQKGLSIAVQRDGISRVGLDLYGISTSLGSEADEFERFVESAVVIGGDFRDNICGLVFGDKAVLELEGRCGGHVYDLSMRLRSSGVN